MIKLHRLNGMEIVLNAEWIETAEATPDTVITLVGGKKFIVLDHVDEVIAKVIAYRQSCGAKFFPSGEAGAIEQTTNSRMPRSF